LRAVKLRTNEYAYNYTMRGVCAFFASTPAVMVTLICNIIFSATLVKNLDEVKFYYLISFAICTRFLNLCNEKMSLAINGRAFSRKFQQFSQL